MPTGPSTVVFALVAAVLTMAASHADRRVVDMAEAGNPQSEATHGYAGHDTMTGFANGKPFRQARGWMHYALTTYDDTEVTVALTFAGADSVPRSYGVVVEDSLIATRTLEPGTDTLVTVEFAVPFAITKGMSNIAVTVRARGGLTPALHEIRTVQDHNEVHSGADRPSPSSPSLVLSGVVR